MNYAIRELNSNESDELKTSSKTNDGKVINTEYKYDIFGNKIESSSDGTAKVYRYNDKNQEWLTDIYYAGGYKEYYSYDKFDQLTTLKSNKNRKWNYEYDAEGECIHEEKCS